MSATAPVARNRRREASRRTPVRFAVVGLGYWGPNLVRVLHDLPGAEIAYVCDVRRRRLKDNARRFPAVPRTSRFSRILRDRNVDAVVIATPVATHHELAAEALEAGKHVFVEKPLATSAAEAEDLVVRARERERVLMPGHTFLYSPSVNVVRDLIVSGELGDIHFVSTSRVNLGLHQADTSVAWDLAPHDFSILLYWLSEAPSHVTAISRGFIIPETPDVAFITLEFASGTIAHVELAWLAPSKLRRTTVVGSRKMVVYDDTSREPVRIFDSGVSLPNPESFGDYQMTYRTGDIVSPRIEAMEPLSLEMADFVAAIRSRTTPRSSADLGVEVVRMIEAVDRSVSSGAARIALPGISLNGNRPAT